jgi:5-formyltetrahydrofolate cyclo-ligase
VESISEIKRTLREQYRRDRELRYMPESWMHLLQAKEIRNATTVASYLSYGFEPETRDLNSELIRMGKTLVLPRTLKDKSIEWVAWDGNESSLIKNRKILEPSGIALEDHSHIDAVILPALAIDPQGNRLGQGGGSYDRALALLDPQKVWRVALVYAAELTHNTLPTEAHDITINAAATPALLVRFN